MMGLVMELVRIGKSRVATEIPLDRGLLDLDTAWVRAECLSLFTYGQANACCALTR
jgi:hypothetical protein